MIDKTLNTKLSALFKLAMIGAFMAGLGGCSTMSSALGMDKSSPDEFAIITKAPLIIPPDFSLQPPTPGKQGPVQPDPTVVASQAVFKTSEQGGTPEEAINTGPTDGEMLLLASAGADGADGSIRTIVDGEYAATAKKKKSFLGRMMFWKGGDDDAAPPKVVGKPKAKEYKQEPRAKKSKKTFADRIFFWRKDKDQKSEEEDTDSENEEAEES